MKRFIAISFVFIISAKVIYPINNNCYSSEAVSIEIDSKQKKLKGLLTIPSSFKSGDKVAVLVSPPQPFDSDYAGMYSTLADTLSKSGIAVLRYNNRAYSADNDQKWTVYKNMTSKLQIDDIHSAILFLKTDKRFSKSPIGLIGHSEGGSICAQYSVEKTGISFVVLLSSPAVDGCEFQYYVTSMLSISEKQKALKINNDKHFCFIYQKYENIDSIKIHPIPSITSQWKLLKNDIAFSKTGIDSLTFCNKMIETFTSLHTISLFRDKPQKYISQIKCPILAIYGLLDEKYDVPLNVNRMKQYLFEKGNKQSKVICLENLSHNYEKIDEKQHKVLQSGISISHSKDYKYRPAKELLDIVVEWCLTLK